MEDKKNAGMGGCDTGCGMDKNATESGDRNKDKNGQTGIDKEGRDKNKNIDDQSNRQGV